MKNIKIPKQKLRRGQRNQHDEDVERQINELLSEYDRDLSRANATIQRVMSHADIAVFSYDIKYNRAVSGTSGGERIYGYPSEAFVKDPQLWKKCIHPDDLKVLDNYSLTESFPVHTEYRIIRKDGQIRWIENFLYPELDEHGIPVYLDGITIDITQQKEIQARLHGMAYTDLLTGLPNRHHFDEDFSLAVSEASTKGHHFAILYIDFDGFKYINDTFGHLFGDKVLTWMANSLRMHKIPGVQFYRVGGDEFAAIVTTPNVDSMVLPFAENILRQFGDTIELEHIEIRVQCSIGIAIYPHHGQTSDDLLRHADIAMYSAKESGGFRACVYSEDMSSNYKNNLRLNSALRIALQENQFELYYQPKLDVTTGHLCGAEALIRWQNPDLGLVGPNAFIPFAEQSGAIWDIGRWVLENACRQNQQWQKEGLPAIPVSVNVSTVQLENPNFISLVEDVLEKVEIDPQWLELEITESVLVQNLERVSTVIEQLSAMGIRVSVDDFGVGYSSLQYLARLSVGTLKIDRSFTENLEYNENVTQIVASIVQMAHALNMRVVVEGVERAEQVHILEQTKCDELQGFLILRPQPKDKFEIYYKSMTENGLCDGLRVWYL